MRKVVCRMARTDNDSKELPRPLATTDESKSQIPRLRIEMRCGPTT